MALTRTVMSRHLIILDLLRETVASHLLHRLKRGFVGA